MQLLVIAQKDSRTRKSLSVFPLSLKEKKKSCSYIIGNKILLWPHHLKGVSGTFRQTFRALKHHQKTVSLVKKPSLHLVPLIC